MKYQAYKDKLHKLFRERNGYLSATIALSAVVAIQTFVIFHESAQVRVIEQPPAIHGAFSVSGSAASASYLRQMALFIVNLKLSVSPDTVSNQYQEFANYLAPSIYGALQPTLLSEAKAIEHQDVSSQFYPNYQHIEVNTKTLSVLVEGEMHRSVGKVALAPKKIFYRINFSLQNGFLSVTGFQQLKEVNHV